jgi:hypothetical protein
MLLGRQRKRSKKAGTGRQKGSSECWVIENVQRRLLEWAIFFNMLKKGWDGLLEMGHWKQVVVRNWLMKSFKEEGNGLSEWVVRNIQRRLKRVVGKGGRQCSMKFGTGR